MCPLAKFSATIILSAFLTAGTPALSVARSGQVPDPSAPSQQKFESVSGQITAVSGKTFTLATSIVRSSTAQEPQPAPKPGQPGQASHPMTFFVDQNTTISGKLTVGASADVIYRTMNGQNIAVSVRVSA